MGTRETSRCLVEMQKFSILLRKILHLRHSLAFLSGCAKINVHEVGFNFNGFSGRRKTESTCMYISAHFSGHMTTEIVHSYSEIRQESRETETMVFKRNVTLNEQKDYCLKDVERVKAH